MDILELQKSVRLVENENGERLVQLPAELWENFVAGQIPPEPQLSQAERIRAVIRSWQNEDEEESSPNWGEEFTTFLKENRFDLTRNNQGLDEER